MLTTGCLGLCFRFCGAHPLLFCILFGIGALLADNRTLTSTQVASAEHIFTEESDCVGDEDLLQRIAVIKSMAVNVDRSGGDDHRFQRSAVIKRIFPDDLQPCGQLHLLQGTHR